MVEPRLGGALGWAGGRFVLRGAADYTAARRGNRDFSGNARFTVHFRQEERYVRSGSAIVSLVPPRPAEGGDSTVIGSGCICCRRRQAIQIAAGTVTR